MPERNKGLMKEAEIDTEPVSTLDDHLDQIVDAQHAAEKKLYQLIRKYELILDSAGEGIYGLDLSGHTTFVNSTAATLLGYQVQELIGKPMHATLHHSKSDGSPYPVEECPMYAAFREGMVHHIDNEVLWRKDGSCFPVEYTSTPIRDESQQLLGAVVIFQDMTEQRRAEDQFRLVVQGISSGIVIINQEGGIVFTNPTLEKLFGYPEQELRGAPLEMLLPLRFRNRHAHHLRQYFAHPHHRAMGVGIELWGLRKDSEEFPLEISLTPIQSKDGLVTLACIHEITDWKNAEKASQDALEQTREHAKQLLGLNEAAMALNARNSIKHVMQILADYSRSLIGAHEAAASFSDGHNWGRAMWGLSLSDKYSTSQSYDVKPDGSGIDALVCETNQPMKFTQEEWEQHPRWRGFGEEEAHHSPKGWLAVPLLDEDGNNLGLIQLSDKYEGVFTDMDQALLTQLAQLGTAAILRAKAYDDLEEKVRERTSELVLANQSLALENAKRKEVEQEVTKKNHDLEGLLYVAAHDLREPLRAIENFSRIVHDRYKDQLDEKGQDYLRRVAEATKRLNGLIGEILNLSRIQQLHPSETEIDSLEIIQDVLRRLEVSLQDTQAKITILPGLPKIKADPTWTTQALYNLISNANKFRRAESSPEIEIGPYSANKAGRIFEGLVVRDRGPGVPPDQTERIFQLFKRAVGREVDGYGAGLAIVRQVAERHGGYVGVAPREGGGSEFFIAFPKDHEEEQHNHEHPTSEYSVSGRQ